MNTTFHAYRSPYDARPHPRWPSGPLTLVIGGLALLAGCVEAPESHVVSSPPPNAAVVATQTGSGQVIVVPGQTAPGTIILNQAPPATPQVVVTRPERPSSDYEWVDGHWTLRDGRYAWVNGHWGIPPYSGARWMQPYTEQRSDGNYTFYEGHWSGE